MSYYVFDIMQISKKSIRADFYGPGVFLVEHIKLDMCVKFQVNRTNGLRGVAFPILCFWPLATAPPCGWLESNFLWNISTSFPFMVTSFMSLNLSSARQFKPRQKTTYLITNWHKINKAPPLQSLNPKYNKDKLLVQWQINDIKHKFKAILGIMLTEG